jgi:hypothetical protein
MGGRGSASPGSKGDNPKEPLRLGESKEPYLSFGEQEINLAQKLATEQPQQSSDTNDPPGAALDETLATDDEATGNKASNEDENKRRGGRMWPKKLVEHVQNNPKSNERIEPRDEGYLVLDRNDGSLIRTVRFYPGFTWKTLEARQRLDEELAREIIQSPGLQRLLIEPLLVTSSKTTSKGGRETTSLTVIKNLWKKWQRGSAKKKFSAKNFTDYVAKNGKRISTDQKTLLTDTIANYDNLSELDKNRAVLITTEPSLLTELPDNFIKQIEKVLSEPKLLGNNPYLEEARKPLINKINKSLAENIKDYTEFEAVMRAVEQPASRGAIAEVIIRRFFVGERTASEESRKPYIDKSLTGLAHSVQPDMLRPRSRRTMDVKCGYASSDIDLDQARRYSRLVEITNEKGYNIDLKEVLENLGLEKSTLEGHDYIFISDGQSSSHDAAKKAYELIEGARLEERTNIYYIDRHPEPNLASSGIVGVYMLEFDEDENKIIGSWLGTSLPD